MSRKFDRFIIELGEPTAKKWSEEWRDDMAKRLSGFYQRLHQMVEDEGLQDQIDLRTNITIGGTSFVTLECTREMSERIRNMKGVKGVFNDTPVQPFNDGREPAEVDPNDPLFGNPPRADSRKPITGPNAPRQSIMVQLDIDTGNEDPMSASYRVRVRAGFRQFRQRLQRHLVKHGMETEVDWKNIRELEMVKTLAITCTPAVIKAIEEMKKTPKPPQHADVGLPVEQDRYLITVNTPRTRDRKLVQERVTRVHALIAAMLKEKGLEGEATLHPVNTLSRSGLLTVMASPSVAALIQQVEGVRNVEREKMYKALTPGFPTPPNGRKPGMNLTGDGPDVHPGGNIGPGGCFPQGMKQFEFKLNMINRMAPEGHVRAFLQGMKHYADRHGLQDEIDLASAKSNTATGTVRLKCSPQLAHAARSLQPTSGEPTEVTEMDLIPHILTLKEPKATDANAHMRQAAIFQRALGNLLARKGLQGEAKLGELDDLSKMGILTLDCSPKVAELIKGMERVDEIREEEIFTTQKKTGADRGYKPTPPTYFGGNGSGPDKNCWDPRQHGDKPADAGTPTDTPSDKPTDPMAEMRDWQVQIKLPGGERSNEASRKAFATFNAELNEMLEREGLKEEVDMSGVGSRYALGVFEIRATFRALRKIEELDSVQYAGDIPDFLDRRRPVNRRKLKADLPTL
ncbi:MAG: hypothetical protein Alpg2KO_18160 [Alphaproteobacteria bacterium]